MSDLFRNHTWFSYDVAARLTAELKETFINMDTAYCHNVSSVTLLYYIMTKDGNE